jgi:hypothetical protein
MIQLDFFEQDETTVLRHRLNDLKDSQDKVRKGLYARNSELQKKYDNLLQRLEVIETHICRAGA